MPENQGIADIADHKGKYNKHGTNNQNIDWKATKKNLFSLVLYNGTHDTLAMVALSNTR